MAAVTRKSNKFINFRKILNINIDTKKAGLGPYELDSEISKILSINMQRKLIDDVKNADKIVFRIL